MTIQEIQQLQVGNLIMIGEDENAMVAIVDRITRLIPATKVRGLIEQGNWEELRKWVPDSVFNRKETLKQHIELAKLIKS